MTTFFPSFHVFDDCFKPKCKVIFQKHLNYSFRYNISERGLVTSNRDITFNVKQIRPGEKKCLDGKCLEELCQYPDEGFPTCCFEWSNFYKDPTPALMRGKKVDVSPKGMVAFYDVTVKEENLDMNWRRLRAMAWPIVDEALGRLAMDGRWSSRGMSVNLGVMLVNNKIVKVDKTSYFLMEKDDDGNDLKRCAKAWEEGERKRLKEGGQDDENTPPQATNATNLNMEKKKEAKKDKEDDIPGTMLCEECLDDPCVWITKKEEMLNYNDNEHEHLPVSDWPPSNVRRKKIYRQMALYINSGPSGRGLWIELPKCVVDGCRECFPSPTFMGFKEN